MTVNQPEVGKQLARVYRDMTQKLTPHDAVVLTVDPLVLQTTDGRRVEGAVAVGAALTPNLPVILMIGSGRALAFRYVQEEDPEPGQLSKEVSGRLEGIGLELETVKDDAQGVGSVLTEMQRRPAQVTELELVSSTYTDVQGTTQARITANWDDVLSADPEDGGGTLDITGYEVSVRRNEVGAPWGVHTTVVESEADLGPFPSGVSIQVRVRALSKSGVPGEWSNTATIVTAGDTTPPPVPSVPQLEQKLGVVMATWDGKTSTGSTTWPTDLVRIEVAVGTTATPTAVRASLTTGGTYANLTNLPYQVEHWVRFRSVDRSGNASDWSTAASITVQSLVDADLISTTIQDQFDARDAAIQDLLDDLAGVSDTAAAAVTGTLIEYAVNSSETVAPTAGWSDSTPTRTPGSFIWMRTVVSYGDGTDTTSSPVLVTGNDGDPGAPGAPGEKGDPGADGAPGADGVGLDSTEVSYSQTTSGTTAPTSGWQGTVPTLIKGRYLWTRSVWTYSDNSTETGYSVAYVPQDGADGDDGLPGAPGVGITGTDITYAQSTSGTTAPTSGWVSQPPSPIAGRYVWTKTVWTYSDSSTETGYSVGKIGDTGAKGDKGDTGNDGAPGAAGVGIASTAITYAQHTSGTVAPTSGWTGSVPTLIKGRYLWTRSIWTYTDTSTETGYSVAYVAQDGADGDDGLPGAPGVGITGTSITYAQSTSGTTAPTSGWVAQPPTPVAGRYVWTKTVWTYSDTSTETGYSVGKIGDTGAKGDTGSKGDTGTKGDTGATGATGISVTSVTSYFRQVGISAAAPAKPTTATPPTGWVTTEPGYVAATKLYRTEKITYSSGTPAFAYTPVSLVSSYTAAVQAMESANGKNVVIRSTSDASGTVHPETGLPLVKGDVWWKMSSLTTGGTVKGQWTYNGSTWIENPLSHEVIASIDANKITTGWLDVQNRVQANTITADKVLIGSASNMIPNGDLNTGQKAPWDSGLSLNVVTPPTGLPASISCTAGMGSMSYVQGASWFDVVPGAKYHFEVWLKADLPNSRMFIELRDWGGAHAIADMDAANDGGTSLNTHEPYLVENLLVPTTWTRYSGVVTMTATATRARLGSVYFNHSNGTERNAVQSLAGMRLRPMSGAVLIENGAVTSDKIYADQAMANKLAAVFAEFGTVLTNFLRADHILAGSFQGYSIEGAEIISRNPNNPNLYIRLKDQELTFNRLDTSESPPEEIVTTRIGGQLSDRLTLGDLSGNIGVSFDGATGDGALTGHLDVDSLSVGGTGLNDLIDSAGKGVLAYMRAVNDSPQAGSSTLGYIMLAAPTRTDRMYRLHVTGMMAATTPGDTVLVAMQAYEPSTKGLNYGNFTIPKSTASSITLEAVFPGIINGVARFGLVFRNVTANRGVFWSGRPNYPVYYFLEDIGPRQFNVGSAYAQFDTQGGTPIAGGTNTDETGAVTHTKEYTATWSRSWRGGSIVSDYLHQGYWGGYQRYSMVGFGGTLASDLSGATNITASVYLNNVHWYSGSGTVLVSSATNTSAPSSAVLSGAVKSTSMAKGAKAYVPVGGFGATSRAITLGYGSNSSNTATTYGKFLNNLSTIKLKVTYTK